MRRLLAICLALLCQALEPKSTVLGPFAVSMNYPADLTGTPDTRPTTWGLATAQTVSVPFHPPAGYRVRVLRVYGNYMAWARGSYAPGHHVGASWGLTTGNPVGSDKVDFAAEGCFLWLQYGLGNGEVNQPFDLDTHVNGLLGPDNVMKEVSAVFLNDEPISVHAEMVFILIFQFEREP